MLEKGYTKEHSGIFSFNIIIIYCLTDQCKQCFLFSFSVVNINSACLFIWIENIQLFLNKLLITQLLTEKKIVNGVNFEKMAIFFTPFRLFKSTFLIEKRRYYALTLILN